MKKLLLVGGGGIGSWLTARLSRLHLYNQLVGVDSVFVADYDEVEEKNLPYQNFLPIDITDKKITSLEEKYNMVGLDQKIKNDKDLLPFDIIICAVDNAKTRKLIYEHCLSNDKFFIDLRSEGSTVWGISSDAGWSLERLIESLGDLEADSKSCQLAYELEAGIVQLGNTIIAEIGAQWLLNHLRGKKNGNVFTRRF